MNWFFIPTKKCISSLLPKKYKSISWMSGLGAASCKSQQEKNKSTRKNNSIRKHILYLKMCFLVE